jgi:hypothetical protein
MTAKVLAIATVLALMMPLAGIGLGFFLSGN